MLRFLFFAGIALAQVDWPWTKHTESQH